MKSNISKIESNTTKINRVEVNMAELKTDLTYLKEGQRRMDSKLDEFIKSADGKYASKLSEQIVYGLVGLILVAVVTALVALVL